jgi:signal recognition particle subunit SRP54
MADMMKKMAVMGLRDRMRMTQELAKGGMMNPGGMLTKQKGSTGKRLSPQERAKLRKQREKEMRRKKRGGGKD